MFQINDVLTYLPGDITVTVLEVHEAHIIVKDDESDEILTPIYEHEYSEYVHTN